MHASYSIRLYIVCELRLPQTNQYEHAKKIVTETKESRSYIYMYVRTYQVAHSLDPFGCEICCHFKHDHVQIEYGTNISVINLVADVSRLVLVFYSRSIVLVVLPTLHFDYFKHPPCSLDRTAEGAVVGMRDEIERGVAHFIVIERLLLLSFRDFYSTKMTWHNDGQKNRQPNDKNNDGLDPLANAIQINLISFVSFPNRY